LRTVASLASSRLLFSPMPYSNGNLYCSCSSSRMAHNSRQIVSSTGTPLSLFCCQASYSFSPQV